MAVDIQHHVGRLIEVRMGPVVTSEEYRVDMSQVVALARQIGVPVVLVSDCRRCLELPPSVAVTVGRRMRVMNDWLLRVGLLLPTDRSFSLHAARIIAEAGEPARRTFQSAVELEGWLSDVLAPPERERLAQFLATQ